MCGRFALRLDRPHIRRALPDAEQWLDEDHFVPRYNIAPRTYSPVIRRARPGRANREHDSVEDSSSSDSLVLHSMKWGLVPHWSKIEDKSLSTTNARSENLVDGGGMWASIKGRNRCAVVCQGYYEWLTKGKEKLPHFVKRDDGQLMLMAGLYDHAIIDGTPKGRVGTFEFVFSAIFFMQDSPCGRLPSSRPMHVPRSAGFMTASRLCSSPRMPCISGLTHLPCHGLPS
jgi:putative SOS response-associated peptidase YedK